ncbi:MutS-related protein [Myroides indicus]|uniref:MutS-like protein n=1 Tax=Myroides indicus TaxID=1323422 RepID=A0A4R7EM05_9FLAO|nr:DNA mismatch repair protein MutS [Myroides indicus]TDS50943.1 MutS-like protein [Myroides indicus]
MEIYHKRKAEFKKQFSTVRTKYKTVGALRIFIFLVIIYFFYLSVSNGDFPYLYVSGIAVILFVVLLKIHAGLSFKTRYLKALVDINQNEINFLEKEEQPFEDGSEFITANHAYSHDLDIFGTKSLYQYLNRTASYIGKRKLADLLQGKTDKETILQNQEVVKELADKVEWRQTIYAYSKISNLDKDNFERLQKWSTSKTSRINKADIISAYLFPFLMLISIAGFFVNSSNAFWGYAVSAIFSLNLIIALSKIRNIQTELGGVEKIYETIGSYSSIALQIEKEDFRSSKMSEYTAKLQNESFYVSKELKILSRLFGQLETVANIFIMIVFNGFFQYHVHVLNKFLTWKKNKGGLLLAIIEIMGEIEALNSLANFSYNNKTYAFPILNNEEKISFKKLGHPLIQAQKRVTNSIDFTNKRFVILTGSNMSGKSTFLRTVGVNLVLANAGAPVCADGATFFPLPLVVSMRLTDSLEDSESYFYAEVKRLKMIIEKVKEESCFVLLDEILRGTNSDDKQSGTIGVILKLIQEKTYGIIATHDLEVCNVTYQFPDILINKCFEVEIKNEDLFFDYKIRDGICKNKNATFIMKKMEIID